MAKIPYIGDSSITKKVNGLYIGNQNIASKILKGYIGVDNQAKLWFDGKGIFVPPINIDDMYINGDGYAVNIVADNDQFIFYWDDYTDYDNIKLKVVTVPYETIHDSSTHKSYTYKIMNDSLWREVYQVMDGWPYSVITKSIISDGSGNYFISMRGSIRDRDDVLFVDIVVCTHNFSGSSAIMSIDGVRDSFSVDHGYWSTMHNRYYGYGSHIGGGNWRWDLTVGTKNSITPHPDVTGARDYGYNMHPIFVNHASGKLGILYPNPYIGGSQFIEVSSSGASGQEPTTDVYVDTSKPTLSHGPYVISTTRNDITNVTLYKYTTGTRWYLRDISNNNNLIGIVPYTDNGKYVLYVIRAKANNITIQKIDYDTGDILQSYDNSDYNNQNIKRIVPVSYGMELTRNTSTSDRNSAYIGNNKFLHIANSIGDGSILSYRKDPDTGKFGTYYENIMNYL